MDKGIDLSEFYMSVEWDLLGVPAFRNEEYFEATHHKEEGEEEALTDEYQYHGKLLTGNSLVLLLLTGPNH